MRTGPAKLSLPYGSGRLDVQLPRCGSLVVASPREARARADVETLVRQALREPIGAPPFSTLLKPGQRLLLLVDDITRPTPASEILPVVLDELGVHEKGTEVTVLLALGTHRPMTPDEIRRKVGAEVATAYPVVNHQWEDETELVDLGTTSNGTPIKVNRLAREADLCIGLGNVVPHNIAGWAGGGKIVQPGICGKETTYGTHLLAARCPASNLGKISNPVRSEIEEVASRTGLAGIVNTVLDRHGAVVHVVAGHTRAAFRKGVELARPIWEVHVPHLADIVLVSSHPADIDFWQANKGLYAAERVVKRGGDIILLTPCPEGLSTQREHVAMLEALEGLPSRSLFHEAKRRGLEDYAALAVSDTAARCRELAWVTVVSEGLTDRELEILGLDRADCVEGALATALSRQGDGASIVVLTHGGESLPVVGQS